MRADHSHTLITRNNSPDLGFEYSINPYRGCEHGCIYCYARPTHETLGMNCGLDFESQIIVKYDAAAILRRELSRPSWKGSRISMSTVTDCYQPVERKLEITRGCLSVMADFRQAVTIITKNHLVTRDIDLLAKLSRFRAVVVCISITTLRPELSAIMEPRTSVPRRRLEAISVLRQAGIEVGTLVAPVIPGLNDTEIAEIISAAADAGAGFASMTPVRLPYQVKELFQHWLGEHMPDREDKILHRIADIRGGKLNDSRFFRRFEGEGIFAGQMQQFFEATCRRAKICAGVPRPEERHFLPPRGIQLELFESGDA
jgi:DNA repair photolyase